MSLQGKALPVWNWLVQKFQAVKAAVQDMSGRTLTDREFEVIKRVPPAIAASAITVVAINLASTGAMMSLAAVVVLGALFVVSLMWSTKADRVVPAITETVAPE